MSTAVKSKIFAENVDLYDWCIETITNISNYKEAKFFVDFDKNEIVFGDESRVPLIRDGKFKSVLESLQIGDAICLCPLVGLVSLIRRVKDDFSISCYMDKKVYDEGKKKRVSIVDVATQRVSDNVKKRDKMQKLHEIVEKLCLYSKLHSDISRGPPVQSTCKIMCALSLQIRILEFEIVSGNYEEYGKYSKEFLNHIGSDIHNYPPPKKNKSDKGE